MLGGPTPPILFMLDGDDKQRSGDFDVSVVNFMSKLFSMLLLLLVDDRLL